MQFNILSKAIFLKKYCGIVLLLSTVIVGLFSYKDYGISWDEPFQHCIGQTNYNYIRQGNYTNLSFKNSDYLNSRAKAYGVAFEVPLIVLEKLFGLKDTRDIYLMRHLVTHLFFLIGAFSFFLLIDYIYKNKLLAVVGFLLLILNPLIYGHSFFNSKDIPFLSLFIICFLLFAIAFNKNTYKHFALLGVGCGLLTDIRIMGVLLIVCTCLFLVIDFITLRRDKKQQNKAVYLFITFITVTLLVLVIAWPYLWINPVENFIDAFKSMSRYNWDNNVMFNGHIIAATNLPWHYSITWFLVTNPIIYIVLGGVGIMLFIYNFYKSYKNFVFNGMERNNLLYLFCFIAPFLMVIILHSVLYDSWRQLYFVYPPFVLLLIYGLDRLLKTKLKSISLIAIAGSIVFVGSYMITQYPFEYIYFNQLVKQHEPEQLRRNWELDYWGNSFKQGFEYILKHDTSSNIKIKIVDAPGIYNYEMLKPEDKKRIHFLDDGFWYAQTNSIGLDIPYVTNKDSTGSYFMTIYRYHHNDYSYSSSQVYYSIKVLNSSILTIFKLK